MRLFPGLSGPSLTRHWEGVFQGESSRGRPTFWAVPGSQAAHFVQQRLAAAATVFAPDRILSWRKLTTDFLGAPPPPRAWIDARLRVRLPEQEEPRLRNYARVPTFRDRVARLIEELGAATAWPGPILRTYLGRRPSMDPVSRDLLRVAAAVLDEATATGFRWPGQLGEWRSSPMSATDRAAYLVDGFRDFTLPERNFLGQLALRNDVWVSLPSEGSGPAASLRQWLSEGAVIDSLPSELPGPTVQAIEAATQEDEATEIARQLLSARRSGRRWAECAVLLRQNGPFAALIRSTLDRFGIPVHDEFTRPLANEAPIAFLLSLIECRETGWSHDALLALAVNRAAPFPPDTAAHLALRLAESRPAAGLDGLPDLASFLQPLASWPLAADPADWAERLGVLPGLAYRGQRPDPAQPEALSRWRQRASALGQWPEVLRSCAAQLPSIPIPLAGFLEELHHHLRLTPAAGLLPATDAVTLTAVSDCGARHWPIVVLPEMRTGVYPQRIVPDPLLDDRTRGELSAAGLPLRTTGERQEAEAGLLPWVMDRAADAVILTYARFGPAGEMVDPSPVLASMGLGPGRTLPCRPHWPARPILQDPPLPLPAVAPPPDDYKYRPSEIDSYRGCPFRHFGQYRLRLRLPPLAPSERFDAREQGSLIHRVLHRWVRETGEAPRIFAEEFELVCRRKNIPVTHQVEFARLEIARHLAAFLESADRPRDRQVFTEWPFELALAPGINLSGRIDRFDLTPEGEATAIDYKYSKRDNLRALRDSVQGGLYLLALEAAGYRPVSFAYIPLRDRTDPVLFDEVAELMAEARERTLDAVARLREEEPAARPADPALCRTCDFIDVCRIREQEEPAAEGASL